MYIKKTILILCLILFSIGCGQAEKKEKKSEQKTNISNTVENITKANQKNNGWFLNYEEVYQRSIKENKPIMANFTGSDWCGWCKKLKKAVFDTEVFKNWAEKNVILFELDYPRRTPQDPEIKKQNAELQQTFRSLVRGYPTVLIFDIERSFDNNGGKNKDNIKIHGNRMGYMPDPDSFINVANQNLQNRK